MRIKLYTTLAATNRRREQPLHSPKLWTGFDHRAASTLTYRTLPAQAPTVLFLPSHYLELACIRLPLS